MFVLPLLTGRFFLFALKKQICTLLKRITLKPITCSLYAFRVAYVGNLVAIGL